MKTIARHNYKLLKNYFSFINELLYSFLLTLFIKIYKKLRENIIYP